MKNLNSISFVLLFSNKMYLKIYQAVAIILLLFFLSNSSYGQVKPLSIPVTNVKKITNTSNAISDFHDKDKADEDEYKDLKENEEESENAYDEIEKALEYEFNMIKDPATGTIPEGVFESERAQVKKIVQKQQADNLDNFGSYSFVGPDNIGGRTRTITYDVRYNGTSNQIIFAGGVSGGVYKSIDNGTTWVRKSPLGEHFSCTSIAQDTRVGFQDTWYYGVGESSGNSAGGTGAFYSGNGVYKSTNNGETWTRLANSNTTALETFSVAQDFISKVVVDPTSGSIYIACPSAIRRSTDGGSTWATVLSGTLASTNQITDIVVTSTGRFYASFSGSNSVGFDGVWSSPTGASASWTRIASPGAPVGWNANAAYGRVVLAIAPSSENLVYALYFKSTFTCGAPSPEAELFRWNNTTALWTDLSATLPDEAGCLAGNDPFACQSGYDLVVSVKPDDPTTVFIGGTNIYRSINSGASWTRIGGYAGPSSYAKYLNSHPDIHAIVFQPGNSSIMLCGNDGGIQRTSNNLAASVVWTPINSGYRTYQYYYVDIDPREGFEKVIGGAQDNGTTRNVGGMGSTFESVYGGDGVSVGLTDLIAGIQYEYGGSQFGSIVRRDASSSPGSATDITPTSEAGTGLFVTLFKLDPDNTQRLYYTNDNVLYRTTSASTVTTATWTSMTGVATSVGAANDISAIGLTRGVYNAATSSIFLGTTNSKVFRLDNPTGVAAATVPVDISGAAFPAASYVSSIAVNPRNDDTVLVTFSNYGVTSVFWTGNANAAVPTWTLVEGALSLPSYRSSAITVTSTGVYYFVGTSAGLFNCTGLPGSTAWGQEGTTAMGNSVVTSLALRANDNRLLVGTHGYGMWYANLPTPVSCSVTLTSAAGTNAQTVCLNSPITTIEYTTTVATGAIFSGLPAGVTGVWSANKATITGTPSSSGTYNYTVLLTGGCGSIKANGTIASADPFDNNACTVDACNTSTGVVTHTPVYVDDGNACTTDACVTSTNTVTITSTNVSGLPVTWLSTTASTPNYEIATNNVSAVFPTGSIISDVSVSINLNHTWGGDMTLFLKHPNGVNSVGLINDPSDSQLKLGGGSGAGPSQIYTFTSTGAAMTILPDPSIANTILSPGPYKPVDASGNVTTFSTFNGLYPNGLWSLILRDDVSGDGGTVENFSLSITTTNNVATISHISVNTNDGNACTTDACNTSTGAITHNSVVIDDGNPCTTDACNTSTGAITHTAVSVDDGNACTLDNCNSSTGAITHTNVNTDDGNACTTDACNTSTGAITHTAVSVDDDNACTLDNCNSSTGAITHTNVNTDDGNACTSDACNPTTGSITHTPLSVDDANACTFDDCDSSTGVFHNPVSTDDGNVCTTDGCDSSTGVFHNPVSTDDANACTDDGCDSSTGIFHNPVSTDDGNACTTDGCDSSTGVFHNPVSTDDGNACTTDGCNTLTGIFHIGLSADDGNACTIDGCNTTLGVFHSPVNIDDGNVCTTDGCDSSTGVFHNPVSTDDGNACTIDGCDSSTGVYHTPVSTDDGNVCTTDGCDSSTGVFHNPVSTEDGNGCTSDG